MTTAIGLILASTIALPIQSVPPSQLPRPYGYPETRPPEAVEDFYADCRRSWIGLTGYV